MGSDGVSEYAKAVGQAAQLGIDEIAKLRADLAAANLRIDEWEKLVRAAADQIYALGKQIRGDDAGIGTTLRVLSTEMHRECQVIKGEDPLPHAGERLTEKQKCSLSKPMGNGETCTSEASHRGPCDYTQKREVSTQKKVVHCDGVYCFGADKCQCKCYACLQIGNF